MLIRRNVAAFLLIGVLAGLGFSGCQRQPDSVAQTPAPSSNTSHSHSGWWCPEHGIPEEICTLCSAKAAADFKAKGDWCVEHNRAASQCFKCDPQRAQKFAKLYEAKYGRQPPPLSE